MSNQSQKIAQEFELLKKILNQKQRRLFAGAKAITLGKGGVKIIANSIGMSINTVRRGKKELETNDPIVFSNSVRNKGGGRKKEVDLNPNIGTEIDNIMEESTIGDPMSSLKWTSKSLRKIQAVLKTKGINIGYDAISRILKSKGYSLQLNKKMIEGGNHEDRDEQFKFISSKTKEFQDEGYAVISIDTKKKELIGNFKNGGSERVKKGEAEKVNVYDFINLSDGKVSPYGVYDITDNKGLVNLGTSADTAKFAVESIRKWLNSIGSKYKSKPKIYINADGGGSNGSRVRLRKVELQKLANEQNIEFHVSHFPPGTSKRNKIEHRMFCYISKNWRGKPLKTVETVVNLIGNTKTKKGLDIVCKLDLNIYEKGIKISDEEFAKINLKKEDFHGEWNYIIGPNIA